MVKIRLARSGSRKRPYYHVTVADVRSPRDGRFIERVGFFNPIARGGEQRLRLNQERIDYWVRQGAHTSERVTKLLAEWAAQGGEAKSVGAPEKAELETGTAESAETAQTEESQAETAQTEAAQAETAQTEAVADEATGQDDKAENT